MSADASSYGLGGVLLQLHGKMMKPVAFCSRMMTSAETRYSQIEKECLALVWACEKFARYLVGLKEYVLLTDHKPLVPLLSGAISIEEAPVRCQRMIIRMMRFNPTVQHVPGKDLVVADALSRKPIPLRSEDTELSEEVEAYVDAVTADWPVSQSKLDQIRESTARDDTLRLVMKFVMEGWPRRESSVSSSLKSYYDARAQLSVYQGLLVYRDRIVVPEGMRDEMLKKLHESHQGISKMRERAKSSVWWPKIGQELKQIADACAECRENRPTQRYEPLEPVDLPQRPWMKVGTDLFQFEDQTYLVAIDYYSRWIEIKQLVQTKTQDVIAPLKQMFMRFGIPDEVVSDNGPQYASHEFANFSREWGFKHHTTNPHSPHENGMAERAVQTAKNILKLKDPELGLLNYRATPHSATGVSPSKALMGREIQTRLPVLPRQLLPEMPDEELRASDRAAKQKYKKYFDDRHGVRSLPPIPMEEPVLVKEDNERGWRKPGTIVGQQSDRSYWVQTSNRVIRRSRKHLMPGLPTVRQEPDMDIDLDIDPPTQDVPARIAPAPAPGATPPPSPMPRAPPTPRAVTPPTPPRAVTTRCGRAIVRPARYN